MLQRFIYFTNNLKIINNGIQKLKGDIMKQYGLKGGYAMYLFYLAQHREGLTVSQMSELNSVSKPAVSKVYSDLYRNGYIDFPDFQGGKKYNTAAVLTEKGLEKTELINEMIVKLVDVFSLTNIKEDDRTTMYRALRTIANNITAYLEQGKL